jgi:multidrug resistance protein, MATE family
MDLRINTGYRDILKMAMPISLAMLVPQINFVTNNIFLAGLGEQALASAGITGVYYLIFAVVGNGLNNGLQALIARRAGQNLPEQIGQLFYHGVWLAMGLAAVGIIITYSLAPAILHATIHNEATANQVINFLLIRIWGLPLLYLYVMRNALLVGTNQTKFLIWGTLSEAIANIFLDYALIYGKFGFPNLGFNGAAYASIAAEGIGLVVIFVVIHVKGINRQFSLFKKWRTEWAITRLILEKSSPLIVQFAISIMSWEFFYILIEHHGERALAVSNTMRNIFGVTGIFAWAFAATANTMVSNLIGQKREADVLPLIKRIAWISTLFSIPGIILLNLKPEWFLTFYNQGEGFVTYAIPVLRVVSAALFMMAFSTVWLNSVTGTGNTVVNLTIEGVAIVVYTAYVYIVLEYLNLSITWGWVSEWVYWIAMFIPAYWYMQSGRWKGKTF